MKFADAVKEMLRRARTTQKGICEKAGCKSIGSISNPLSRGDMQVSTLVKFANAAGYDVMLVRRDAIEPEYPIKIEYGETEK